MIRRLLDREVARGTAGGRGKVSRAELLEVAAQITDLAERAENQSPTPGVEDATKNVGPQPGLDASRTMRPVAPVGELEADAVAVGPPAPVAELEPAPEALVLGLWPVGKARVLLADLDRVLHLTDTELAEHLAERGIPRPMFDSYLKRELGKWLGTAKVPPADPREAVAALAAELRDALASGEAEAVPVP